MAETVLNFYGINYYCLNLVNSTNGGKNLFDAYGYKAKTVDNTAVIAPISSSAAYFANQKGYQVLKQIGIVSEPGTLDLTLDLMKMNYFGDHQRFHRIVVF